MQRACGWMIQEDHFQDGGRSKAKDDPRAVSAQ
jgi:hypothetical protein